MTNGLVGTPMPSYGRALPEEDRWALSYYVLALSAFTDPLTGEPLQINEQDRAALNDPALKASESHYAYKPQAPGAATQFAENPPDAAVAGEVWAERHGVEVAPAAAAAK
jgi:cytochrome c oxidase cbb3-type subunit 2